MGHPQARPSCSGVSQAVELGFHTPAFSPFGGANGWRYWTEGWLRPRSTQATQPPQLLNCIMDMAEKTRRSLTVLRRCQEADREELNHWARRYSDTEDTKKGPAPPAARPLNSSAGVEGSQLGACWGAGQGEQCRQQHGQCRGPCGAREGKVQNRGQHP